MCQEGTIQTIESQTQALLKLVRAVCVSIRIYIKNAGSLLKASLVNAGKLLLQELSQLMIDLSQFISTEWKNNTTNREFQSPINEISTNAQEGSQIAQDTHRVRTSGRKLAIKPVTDAEAITKSLTLCIPVIAVVRILL